MMARDLVLAIAMVAVVLSGCRDSGRPLPPPAPPTATVASLAAPSAPTISSPEDFVIIIFADSEPDVGPAPLTVEFSISDPFMELEEPQYHWDFGDGSPPSSKRRPTHVYQRPGKYKARLKVSERGADDEDTVDIVVKEPKP